MSRKKSKDKPPKTPIATEASMDSIGKEENAQPTKKKFWRHYEPIEKMTFVMAAFAVIYSVITFGLYYIAKNTLKASQIASARDLRPYIYADKFDFIGDLDEGAFKGRVQFVNTGRTPGIHVEGCADYAFRPKNRPMTDDLACPNPENPATGKPTTGEKSKFVLGSSLPFYLYTPGFSLWAMNPNAVAPYNPKIPMSTVLKSGFFLYMYGDVSYTDLIDPKTIHHTYFCGRYNPDTKGFDVCEKHNGMD